MEGGEDAAPTDVADDDPAERQCADRHQAAKAGHAPALPGSGDVGTAENGVAHDPRDRPAGGDDTGGGGGGNFLAGTCGGGNLVGRPTHDDSVHSPEDVYQSRESHRSYDLAK